MKTYLHLRCVLSGGPWLLCHMIMIMILLLWSPSSFSSRSVLQSIWFWKNKASRSQWVHPFIGQFQKKKIKTKIRLVIGNEAVMTIMTRFWPGQLYTRLNWPDCLQNLAADASNFWKCPKTWPRSKKKGQCQTEKHPNNFVKYLAHLWSKWIQILPEWQGSIRTGIM